MGKGKKKRKYDTGMPSDIELLQGLGTLDLVEAVAVGAGDQEAGTVPPWCEIQFEAKRDELKPFHVRWHLKRHDAELIIQVLHKVLHPSAGGHVTTMLWAELDEVVDRIQKRVERGRDPLKADVGRAQGLTRAIAILVNPYAYDEDEVREEAMERYEERQPHR